MRYLCQVVNNFVKKNKSGVLAPFDKIGQPSSSSMAVTLSVLLYLLLTNLAALSSLTCAQCSTILLLLFVRYYLTTCRPLQNKHTNYISIINTICDYYKDMLFFFIYRSQCNILKQADFGV